MISVVNVYKTYPYDQAALIDVSFEVDKGDFAYIIGLNGAGKTTLLKLIFCAEKPTKGEIFVDGMNIAELKESNIPFFRRKIGVIFQDYKLLNNRTVFENVALALEIVGEKKKSIQKKVWGVLRLVGLHSKSDSYPITLSGGEQQRTAIARAMVKNPLILLADEPTGNLDPDATRDILKLLNKINLRGTTVFFATHDPKLVPKDHKKVFILDDGRMVSP